MIQLKVQRRIFDDIGKIIDNRYIYCRIKILMIYHQLRSHAILSKSKGYIVRKSNPGS